MKLISGIKVTALGVLILSVFSLPTLTATQLVRVLGTSTVNLPLIINPVSSNTTNVTELSSNEYRISWVGNSLHQFVTITNSNTTSRFVGVSILSSSNNLKRSDMTGLLLTSKNGVSLYRLEHYNYVYQITVNHNASLPLYIDTSAVGATAGTMTLLIEGE